MNSSRFFESKELVVEGRERQELLFHVGWFARTRIKLIKQVSHLRFLTTCKDLNVIPKFLRIKNKAVNARDDNILKVCELKRLRSVIRCTRVHIDRLSKALYHTYLDVSSEKHNIEFDGEFRKLFEQIEITEKEITRRHNKKLSALIGECEPKQDVVNNDENRFINMSKVELSVVQMKALNRGIRYAFPVEYKNPYRIIPAVENIVRKMPKHEQDKTRFAVYRSIKRQEKKEETKRLCYDRKTLLELRNNPEVAIVMADKSPHVIIMDRSEYKEKVLEALDKIPHDEVTKDPSPKIKIKIAEFKNHSNLPDVIRRKCYPPIGANIPALFGQVKTHKQGNPMRLLVSKFCDHTINIERVLADFLKPLLQNHQFVVKDSVSAVHRIRTINVPDTEFKMFSLDAKNLYPNTPVDIAHDIIHRQLISITSYRDDEVDDIMKMLKFIQENTFFRFDKIIYRQLFGAAIGSPLASVLAEFVIQEVERSVLTRIKEVPILYIRYVDDALVFVKENCDNVEELRQELSSVYPTIEFTIEEEVNNSIPFLDILVEKDCVNKSIMTSVYRKPTYIPAIIPADSYHPTGYKYSAFMFYAKRAITHCSCRDAFEKEQNWILDVGRKFGYQNKTIRNIVRKVEEKQAAQNGDSNEVTKFIGAIPYVPHIANILKGVARKHKMKIGCKMNTIKDMILTNKDKIEPNRKAGVYIIPMEGQQMTYVGSTKRAVQIRLDEHKHDVEKGRNNTALAKYCKNNNTAKPEWNNVKCFNYFRTVNEIRIHESMVIEATKERNCNDDIPSQISFAWKLLINEYEKKKKRNRKRQEDRILERTK